MGIWAIKAGYNSDSSHAWVLKRARLVLSPPQFSRILRKSLGSCVFGLEQDQIAYLRFRALAYYFPSSAAGFSEVEYKKKSLLNTAAIS